MSSVGTGSIALASRHFAVELREVLREMDPARWRAEVALAVRRRLEHLTDRLVELKAAAAREPRFQNVRTRLNELAEVLTGLPAGALDGSGEEWAATRARLIQAYEKLAATLKDHAIHVPALRPTNYARNVLHALTGATAATVALLLPSAGWGMAVAGGLAAWGWSLETTRRIWPGWNDTLMRMLGRFAHPHEAHQINSSTWYLTGLFAVSLCGSMPLVALTMAVMGLGDPAAALIGRRFGRIRLWHGRSLEGTLAFMAMGTLAAWVVVAVATPLTGGTALAICLAAGGVGALSELVSHRVDDNFMVPVAAAAAALAVSWLLGVSI